MVMEDFNKILDMFVTQGGLSIDFVGGEPTLHPRFINMVSKCASAGIDIWVYTNLRQFGIDAWLSKKLLEVGGEKVTVVGKLNIHDLDNPDQVKFQSKLIGASTTAVTEMQMGLNNLLAAGFSKGKIGIENLLRKSNIESAPQVYEEGLKRGFFVDLEIPTCPVSGGEAALKEWLNFFPSKQQIKNCIEAVQKINQHYGIPPYIAIMPHLTGRNAEGVGTGCVSFKRSALLTEADGRIGMCTSGKPLLDKTGRQLNLLRDPVEEIFSHPDLLARRRSCEQKNIRSGPCATCQHWQHCLGGCVALREAHGLLFDSYPACYMHN
jgi:radical SAM protein with 4Fe4S-binding SPASM domain